ncbi:MAG: hypothetical protein HY318_17570 [Armatimonadetes bacterium]|nr:hypothetical protein [Armatimonadota bacterium]
MVLITILGIGTTGTRSHGGSSANSRPNHLLFLHRSFELDPQYVTELQATGFDVTQRALTEPLSLEELKQYHVVVITDLLTLDAAFMVGAVDVPAWWDYNLLNLRKYVQSGGGLLVTAFFPEAGEALAAAYERVLQPWGASFRAEEIIDTGHLANIEGTGKKLEDKIFYCWTDRITRHPATQGVNRIFYPVCNMRWDDCYTTPPILVSSKAWIPLVRAMPGSYTAKANKNYEWEGPTGKEDTIAAVRQIAKGRVGLLSIGSYYTFFRPYTKEDHLGENHHGRIDGIPMKRGDGSTPSDLGRLLENLYGWLAQPGRKAGFGGPAPGLPTRERPKFTVQQVVDWDSLQMPPTWRHRPIPVQENGQMYYDEQPDPTVTGDLHYFKALVGVHSSYSDGKGSVAQFAGAAKKAGYSLIAFTETFEQLGGKERWEKLRQDCVSNSSDSFICLPGIDIADPEGGRYLIFGQPNYPAKTWLSPDGKYLTANNVMSLGFTTHTSVIARPQHSPHQYRMFKHYQGIAVATYRAGKLVDDGYQAYQWSVNSGSNPIPISVHEVFSPEEVEIAARTGFQQIAPSDTVLHASDYFRCGLSHFFDCPQRYFLSEGPVLDTWTIFNKDLGKPEENRDRYRLAVGASSDVPLRELALYADGALFRRWTPNATSFKETVDGFHAWQHHWHLVVTDSLGRRAISPHFRIVCNRYTVRCGDRQNWLGHVAAYYTGTPLRSEWLDLHLPVQGTHEGDSTFAFVKGDNLAPMLEFPLTSNRACVTDFLISQRYPNVEKFDEIAYDAAPMRITVPSRLYEGRVRLTNFTPRPDGPNSVLCQVDLKLKQDGERTGEEPWPWFGEVQGKYYVHGQTGWQSGDIGPTTRLDLQPGDLAGDVVALGEGLRLEGRRFGLVPPTSTAIKANTSFTAQFLLLNRSFAGWEHKPPGGFDVAAQAPSLEKAMGFEGETPVRLRLAKGRLDRIAYAAFLNADEGGVSGEIKGATLPHDLPLLISGLNPRWTAGVWRSDEPTNIADQFGFLDGLGLTTLDGSKAVQFYAGNFVRCDNKEVFLNIEQWTKDTIVVEANNPTDTATTTTIETPREITTLKAMKKTVTIPAGSSLRVRGG